MGCERPAAPSRAQCWLRTLGVLALLTCAFVLVAPSSSFAVAGIDWTTRTSAANNSWASVTYGNGVFVAVSSEGTALANRVMTSPDGVTWTPRAAAADYFWTAVTYGNGVFVAVASTDGGTGKRVMTSPDGITWALRDSPGVNEWEAVTYGGGLFVAVSGDGNFNRVMTSPDGITWTQRNSFNDGWRSVTYGGGLFVAVASSGMGNRVMTSPDGISWTPRASAADNIWRSVTYAEGLFAAVSSTGTGNRVMTSGSFAAPSTGGSTAPAGATPATTALSLTIRPARTRLASGRAMRVTLRTRNAGTVAATAVRSCIRIPRGLILTRAPGAARTRARACYRLGALAPGRTISRTISVRARKGPKATRSLTAFATSSNATRVTARQAKIVVGG